ncbi:adenylate/guanylate cyclase domain-containing protein [Mycobacterium sp. NPDC050551]|uniref:ATP-binding protein n=1 Tax=Mycobacterium sp. NPDC050551 TaxID=3155407 RepID=UPI0034191718
MTTSTPSAVLSFLFTDIEGSTRRWEADAEEMRGALAEHDAVLRDAVTARGGEVFKHTGDGVCAVFGSPRAAVDAAVAAQRALDLPVRMGIATGEAQQRDGDYFGPVLNRVARLMSAGHGGQILLDGAASGLVGDADLIVLGKKRLRDIAAPVEVFQVCADGLATDFPPLRSLDAAPGNLRVPPTSLIGRDEELSAIAATLRKHRLVTLTGVGGVGKTRLALEVAARSVSDHPDGVWVVELAGVSDSNAVAEAAAAILGFVQQPGMTVAESVAVALEGRSRMLVLDNCEHVLNAAADLVELILSRSATVRILATSREGLQVADEQIHQVSPLGMHPSDSLAVELFVDRSRAAAPGAHVSAADEAVADICRRLDGIPLALELAASRLQSMTVLELRDRLDDRFRLLIGSRRASPRHHTLSHAVRWSFDLLDDDQQRALARCSVFAGGFDLSAANAVTATGDEVTTLHVLDALVRKSLLIADRSGERTRYSMLETIRQFGEDELRGRGEADDVRTAHARHFAGLEADVLTRWDGPAQVEVYRWYETELANLRAAYRFAADRGDLDAAATIAVYAAFISGWMEQHEPARWAESLLGAARAADHPRLGQLCVAAAACYRTGRLTQSVEYADAAIALMDGARFLRSPFGIEPTALGGTYITVGSTKRWVELCRNTTPTGEGADAFNQGSLVIALLTNGQVEEAERACDQLLAYVESTDNPCARAYGLLAYGYARRVNDGAAAYDALRRGLSIAMDSGNRMTELYLAVNLSTLAGTYGDATDALDFLASAIKSFYDAGTYAHMVSPLGVLGAHLGRLGLSEQAAVLIGFAQTVFARATFPEVDATAEHLHSALGDDEYARLNRLGANMANSAIAQYALEQIDRARTLT